jgi:O-antigen ligase
MKMIFSKRIDGNLLLQYALIGSALILSVFMGWKANTRWPQLIVMLYVIGVSGYLLFRRQTLGLILLIPVSFFIPFQIGTGTNISLNATILFVMALLGLWIVQIIVVDRRAILPPWRITGPILAFLFVTFLSLISGKISQPYFAESGSTFQAQLGGWLLIVLPMGLLLLSANKLNNLKLVQITTWLFIGFGALFFMTAIPYFPLPPIRDAFVLPSVYSAVFRSLLAALSLGQALWNRELSMPKRVGLAMLAFLVVLVGWYGREWVSGWLPPALAIIILLWLRDWRLGSLFTIILAVILILNFSVISSSVWTGTQQYSSASRQATWPILWQLFKSAPLLGLGPGNYYRYTPYYSIWGFYINFNSHNNFIDIFMQYGLAGMAAFIWCIAALLRMGWKLRNEVKDGFSRGYVNACIAGLIAILVSGYLGDWFLPFLYNLGFPYFRSALFLWLFMGGMVAIHMINKNNRET